eukprot:Pgem_evm1s6625
MNTKTPLSNKEQLLKDSINFLTPFLTQATSIAKGNNASLLTDQNKIDAIKESLENLLVNGTIIKRGVYFCSVFAVVVSYSTRPFFELRNFNDLIDWLSKAEMTVSESEQQTMNNDLSFVLGI